MTRLTSSGFLRLVRREQHCAPHTCKRGTSAARPSDASRNVQGGLVNDQEPTRGQQPPWDDQLPPRQHDWDEQELVWERRPPSQPRDWEEQEQIWDHRRPPQQPNWDQDVRPAERRWDQDDWEPQLPPWEQQPHAQQPRREAQPPRREAQVPGWEADQPGWEAESTRPQPRQRPGLGGQPRPSRQETGSEPPTDVFGGGRTPRPVRQQFTKPRGTQVALVLAVLGAVIAIMAAGTALNTNKYAGNPAADTSPQTTPATKRATPASNTVPATETTSQAVKVWWNGGGQSDLQAVIAAVNATRAAATAGRMPAMARDCTKFSAAVTKLRAAGQMPSQQAQKWLAQALVQWGDAAAKCRAGARTRNAASIQLVTTDMKDGRADVRKATKVIDGLIGS